MKQNTVIKSIILALSPLILLWPAIYNGFPFYYYDLADYIYSAFLNGYVSVLRPIGYGYFLRIFSFSYSLWIIAFIQAVIGSYIIFRLLKIFFQKNIFYVYLSTLTILSLLSSVSWFTSFLMPDIFISFGAIAVFILIFEKSDWIDKLLPTAILIVSAFIHTSNPPILLAGTIGLLLVIMVTGQKDKKIISRQGFIVILIILISVMLIKVKNRHNDFAYNHASHAFIIGRLEEIGILQEFLTEKCPQEKYELCTLYKNFHKDRREGFLWEDDSPLMARGWKQSKAENEIIIKEIFKKPKYIWTFFAKGLIGGLLSLQKVDINDFGTQDQERYETYYPAIKKFFPADIVFLKNSLQFRGEGRLQKEMLNIFIFTIFISLVGIIIFYNKADKEKKFFLLLILIIILSNAILTSTLSTAPSDRYTARVAWLVPLAGIIFCQRKKLS